MNYLSVDFCSLFFSNGFTNTCCTGWNEKNTHETNHITAFLPILFLFFGCPHSPYTPPMHCIQRTGSIRLSCICRFPCNFSSTFCTCNEYVLGRTFLVIAELFTSTTDWLWRAMWLSNSEQKNATDQTRLRNGIGNLYRQNRWQKYPKEKIKNKIYQQIESVFGMLNANECATAIPCPTEHTRTHIQIHKHSYNTHKYRALSWVKWDHAKLYRTFHGIQ